MGQKGLKLGLHRYTQIRGRGGGLGGAYMPPPLGRKGLRKGVLRWMCTCVVVQLWMEKEKSWRSLCCISETTAQCVVLHFAFPPSFPSMTAALNVEWMWGLSLYLHLFVTVYMGCVCISTDIVSVFSCFCVSPIINCASFVFVLEQKLVLIELSVFLTRFILTFTCEWRQMITFFHMSVFLTRFILLFTCE